MATRSIIKKLNRAIEEKKSPDAINDHVELVIENFAEAVMIDIFYDLPFEKIMFIFKRIDFLDDDIIKNPIFLLGEFIKGTSRVHKQESVLLLNEIKIDNLPPLNIDEAISIISNFANCEILTKLAELYSVDRQYLKLDYEGTIDKLKKQIEEQINNNSELQKYNDDQKRRYEEI